MADVLHFEMPKAELNPALSRLRTALIPQGKSSDLQLRIANRLWGQQGFHFRPEYLEETQTHFGAEMGLVNFKARDATQRMINLWVEKQTDRKITNLIGPDVLNRDTRLVVTNAIYFKAMWATTFNRKLTSEAPFHVSRSQWVPVSMMHQTSNLSYGESDVAQVLKMPYGGSPRLSMVIVLPKKVGGLSDVEKMLNNQYLAHLLSSLKTYEVRLHFPRFKMEAQIQLSDTLQKMGMPLAFTPSADFSGISQKEPLWISAVVHKAFVDVNEEGTEAAAATAGMGTFGGPMHRERVEFRADRPFLFFIQDERTKCILFLGRLTNP
jgi:serpin B